MGPVMSYFLLGYHIRALYFRNLPSGEAEDPSPGRDFGGFRQAGSWALPYLEAHTLPFFRAPTS